MLKKINFISLDREKERVYLCKKYLNPKLMKTQNPNLEETEFIAQLEAEIAEWFNNINDLFDKAYLEYKPIVEEICTRTVPEDEVGCTVYDYLFKDDDKVNDSQ